MIGRSEPQIFARPCADKSGVTVARSALVAGQTKIAAAIKSKAVRMIAVGAATALPQMPDAIRIPATAAHDLPPVTIIARSVSTSWSEEKKASQANQQPRLSGDKRID